MWFSRPFPIPPNQTLHNLHSWPRGVFLNLASLVKWDCSCFAKSLCRSQIYGHRLQIFRSLWFTKKCWLRPVLVEKSLKHATHFHGSDLSRAIFIISLAFDFVVVFLRLCRSVSSSPSSDSESETTMGCSAGGGSWMDDWGCSTPSTVLTFSNMFSRAFKSEISSSLFAINCSFSNRTSCFSSVISLSFLKLIFIRAYRTSNTLENKVF